MKATFVLILLLLLFLSGCQPRKLPFLGEPEIITAMENGEEIEKVQYPVIPAFSFKNQYGQTVTEKTLQGKIYVADFFFTKGPSVCWIMKKNMLQVYDTYKDHPEVGIVSHTIDPVRDSEQILQKYSEKLGVSGNMWHFVTGDLDRVNEIGKKHYLLNMQQDSSEAGVHICAFVLVDKQRRIRGFYDGTDKREVSQLVRDIGTLIEE